MFGWICLVKFECDIMLNLLDGLFFYLSVIYHEIRCWPQQ